MNLFENIKYNELIIKNIIDLRPKANSLTGYCLTEQKYKTATIEFTKVLKEPKYYKIDGIIFHPDSYVLYKNESDEILEIRINELYTQIKDGNNIKILDYKLNEIEISNIEYINMPTTKAGHFLDIKCYNTSVYVPYTEKQILIRDTIYVSPKGK
jgi:hypothetical protein